ncbi:transmembrane GTPase fzo [Drosophila grimshawi]|uniref:transmembrane GTPase fzo n=1 Tax=Drosophila grimshawi TaxID=7222 RepID=UPI000C870B4E|nr:transmembrane GTPase fzo [Drosophila grimshawi]
MCATLSDFGQAKMDLLSIYEDMATHVQQVLEEVQAMPSNWKQNLLNERCIREQLSSCIHRIKAICPMLQRKRMKVAFFGRTSNGKSAVINAMLHKRILPSAMGHTTSCFCQVAASKRDEPAHVLIENGDGDKLSIDCLRDLASAHSTGALTAHSLLHVRFPSSSGDLLANDVVLLDTPGVDVTAQLDECIDRHCLNADVFVLVLNAESTMSRVERQFFELVARQLSRPNLFILNNRWDVAATLEPQLAELVRGQHTQRCLQLLIDELGIYDNLDLAMRRIFHVSAMETLRHREKQATHIHAPGAQQRYEEFLSFEREFAACITQSALKTKFEQHCVGATEMLHKLHELLQQLATCLAQFGEQQSAAKVELSKKYDGWQVESVQQKQQIQLQVARLSVETSKLAAQLLHDQILRLPAAVHHFQLPLHPHQPQYQRLLGIHLKRELFEPLESQLQQQLLQLVQPATDEVPQQLYCSLDCQTLMCDFHADLQFRFSWGMAAILKRLQDKLPLPMLPAPKSLNGLKQEQLKSKAATDYWLLHTDGSLGAMLLLSGILARTLGWRLLLGLSLVTGSFYAYELISWTPQAQERSYKAQYTRHMQRRLRESVQQTATGFSQQVQQHLTHSMQQLSVQMDENRQELNDELTGLENQLKSLQNWQIKLRQLQTEGDALTQRLRLFKQRYLAEN